MCTSTVDDADALPVQPEIVSGLLDVELSAMFTRSRLVDAAQPSGGGVVPPEPVNSSRFGEPVPGLVILFGVAFAFIAAWTSAGVASGWSARYSAAAPTTCGVAIDVPLIVLLAVSLVFHDDVMS